jgi:hypothetical protein
MHASSCSRAPLAWACRRWNTLAMLTSCHAIATCTTPHPRNLHLHKMASISHIFLKPCMSLEKCFTTKEEQLSVLLYNVYRTRKEQSPSPIKWKRVPILSTPCYSRDLTAIHKPWKCHTRMRYTSQNGIHSLQIVSKVIDLDEKNQTAHMQIAS